MSDAGRRTPRTTLQTLFALITVLPLVAGYDPLIRDVPALTAVVGGAALLSRVMAMPAVDRLLPGWLRGPSRGETADADD
ncbi:hypothetical protein ACFWD7_39760 [Streptomyces mirabilis]|uniref:hypothetical protein n=1 Tax=Streptomyces mirabilis TaxID=68239 RepID=UPI0021BE9B83|nr:hypothetical protein [Streptomyces mirabilis]MCT9109176.1 hypothetical protein [Streptomyces mirabilis]